MSMMAIEPIAVIGMAGRFPGADNVDELWDILIHGRDMHRKIPKDRFDVETHVDPTGKVKNTSLTPYGCFYDGIGDFDISLFKMSPREAAQTDPMHRMMLLTAYEALESAGYYDRGDFAPRPQNGTFYGAAVDDYRQANSSQTVDTNYITGGARAFGPGRVSYYFGWEGMSMSIDAACSASAVAMHQAISSLKLGECDVALAGGANLLTCSDMFAGLSRAKFVCTTGPCKTFDETADGYCRADGAATVVFKRLSDAIRDKDNIHGVIRSVETNHAGTAISITSPEDETQTALFKKVLTKAGLTVDDIDHIELHGTGTQAGDLAESKSVTNLLDRPRPKDRPLTISSIKPNIGHSEAASGVTSLIKGLLMMKHQTIPRHVGIKTRLNPKLPSFDPLNVVVPMDNMPYPTHGDQQRRMLVNNFNATGGITAILLEEYKPVPADLSVDLRGDFPIVLSAATTGALRNSLIRLQDHLQTMDSVPLSHLSYTLTARRLHHKHRFACVASSVDDLKAKLRAELAALPAANKQTQTHSGVFVFTGSTSTLPQAKMLFDTNTAFRNHICRSDQLSRNMGLPSFKDVITGANTQPRPCQLQLALVALEIALAHLFRSWGIFPDAVIGHSLGEYAALCVSGVLSLSDTLQLVGGRGMLLESQCIINDFAMAVIALPADDVKALLREKTGCEIACFNSPQQTVVTGKDADIDALISQLGITDVKATKMRVPYGFHSKQMDAILDDYRKVAAGVSFNKPNITMVSTLLAKEITAEDTIDADYMCQQTREPVRFQDGLKVVEKLKEHNQRTIWIELGPTSACSPMIASTLQAKSHDLAAALGPKKSNWSTIAAVAAKYYEAGGTLRWDEYHKEYLDSLEMLQLPSYPFDLKRYWIQYDGDWMIRKNQTPPSTDVVNSQLTKPSINSSTLHHLNADFTENGSRKLIFTTDINKLQTKNSSGSSEFSNSMFAEMAMSAAVHLWKLSDEKCSAVQVSNLEFSPSSVLEAELSLKTEATQSLTASNAVEIVIGSSGPAKVRYARCTVNAGSDEAWSAESDSESYLYQSRIDLMQLFAANGQSSRLSRSEASQLLALEESTMAIEDLIFSTDYREAIATFQFNPSKGDYVCEPECLRLLLQLPTALVSSAHSSSYTGTGWRRLRLLAPFKAGRLYRAHTRLHPAEVTGAQVGDVHILDDSGHTVAVLKQLLMQLDSNSSTFRSSESRPIPQINIVPLSTKTSNLSVPIQRTIEDKNSITKTSSLSTSMYSKSSSLAYDSDGEESTATSASSGEWQRKASTSSKTSISEAVDFNVILDVLAAEIGVEVGSLTDDVELEDLGADSIMQISMFSRVQDCVPYPLPMGFFMNYNSILKIRQYLENLVSASSQPSLSSSYVNPSDATLIPSPVPAATKSLISRASKDMQPVPVIKTFVNQTKNPFQILTRSNRIFETASQKHGFAKYWSSVAPLQDDILLAYINEAFTALGVKLSEEPRGMEIPAVPHIHKYDRLHKRLMDFLENRYIVSQRGGKVLRGSDGIDNISASKLCEDLRAQHPRFECEAALMSLVGPRLADCMSGKVDPISVLFGNDASREIMEEFYLKAPMMATHMEQLELFLLDLLRSTEVDPATPIRILEVGAGTGGTTARLVDALSDAGIPVLYTFTDIGSSFVTRAKARWGDKPWMDFQVMDIERDIPQAFKGKYDIVLGANVVHATTDRIAACRNLRETLQPNGILLLSEITHVINWYDMCFGLLDGWWLADGGQGYPIQPASVWMDAFEKAGFKSFAYSGDDSEESNSQQLLMASVKDWSL